MIRQVPVLHRNSYIQILNSLIEGTVKLHSHAIKDVEAGYTEGALMHIRTLLESIGQSQDFLFEALVDMELALNQKKLAQLELELNMRSMMTAREETVWIEKQQFIADQEAAYYEKREARD